MWVTPGNTAYQAGMPKLQPESMTYYQYATCILISLPVSTLLVLPSVADSFDTFNHGWGVILYFVLLFFVRVFKVNIYLSYDTGYLATVHEIQLESRCHLVMAKNDVNGFGCSAFTVVLHRFCPHDNVHITSINNYAEFNHISAVKK